MNRRLMPVALFGALLLVGVVYILAYQGPGPAPFGPLKIMACEPTPTPSGEPTMDTVPATPTPHPTATPATPTPAPVEVCGLGSLDPASGSHGVLTTQGDGIIAVAMRVCNDDGPITFRIEGYLVNAAAETASGFTTQAQPFPSQFCGPLNLQLSTAALSPGSWQFSGKIFAYQGDESDVTPFDSARFEVTNEPT